LLAARQNVGVKEIRRRRLQNTVSTPSSDLSNEE
jgi:hypothetical protein